MALPARGVNLEILDLRHFSSNELRGLLEQETQVWSHLLDWDYRSSAEMILRYVDSKILPGYAAVENGHVRGYSFFVYEGNKGVIGDLYALRSAATSEQHIEAKLLRHVIETLQQSPGIHRVEAQLLVHATGTLAQSFESQRFMRYPRLFMAQPFTGPKAVPDSRLRVPADIEVRRWSEHDYQHAASVITDSYQRHVDAEINDQYRSVAGSLRFLNNIVRFPGCGTFDGDASFVAVHKPSRQPVGVILCSRVKDNIAHVTQVCVVPEQRGRRIGEALLTAAANDLRRRNFAMLTLTVTEANRAAVRLYEHLGFETRRAFDAFVWEG
jgi:ribosomal protein S18 acetylase RimI-like enzyme